MQITIYLLICALFMTAFAGTGNEENSIETEQTSTEDDDSKQVLCKNGETLNLTNDILKTERDLWWERQETSISDLLRRILRSPSGNPNGETDDGLMVDSLADSKATGETTKYEAQPAQKRDHVTTTENCDFNSPYRTMDGSCNNKNCPTWGSTNQPFIRLVKPKYDDDENIPRLKDSKGNMLPSPRIVSLALHPNMKHDSRDDTLMVMQWGQFLDHDITGTPVHATIDDIKCCDDYDPDSVHIDVYNQGPCFPISIPEKDRHFTKRCMDFRRSAAFRNQSPREQFNILTAFIDGSTVYGVSDDAVSNLRNGAYMKTKGDNLLPESNKPNCRITNRGEWCFAAGDARVNVFPGLSLLHTVFVREHNRLVKLLATVLPEDTPDDVLFQEARKIVSALNQQITYEEWLPILLGPETMEKYKLNVNTGYIYNSSKNPTIANVFATSAFRYGHSEVPRFLRLGGREVLIEELFFRPTELIRDFDAVLESLLLDKRQRIGRFMTSGMTDHMFETSDQNSFDIVSLNIQRGRDHGLPPYNSFRRVCNLPEVTSFDDDVLSNSGSSLGSIYNSPEDIDVFTGGLAEMPVKGGSVGPLLACLIGQQFHNLKFGDSFWYETNDSLKGFTQDQLTEIRQMSFAKLLCANSGLSSIQRYPFKLPSERGNPMISCDNLPTIDITKWRK